MKNPASHWANNMAVFTIFMMSLGGNAIKAEKFLEMLIIMVS